MTKPTKRIAFKFDPNLDFQQEAIGSIVDIFRGQEHFQGEFTVIRPEMYHASLDLDKTVPGYGNMLLLSKEDLLQNIVEIQIRNHLPPSDLDDLRKLEFSIEMETGTGKTYVYLRTIFELNKKYGFSKFVIVVPSVPIREGVQKSLEQTKSHFGALYNNVPYHYEEYSGKNRFNLYDFATSSKIQILIMNIQAFISEKNLINKLDENPWLPIDLIRRTNPVVIVDEPQSAASTQNQRDAIDSLNPLFILNYSATHRRKVNMMYKLDAVDAYQRKLVKQIEVASVLNEELYDQAYVRLISTKASKGSVTARIEIHAMDRDKVRPQEVTVKMGDDLEQISRRRIYADNFIVQDISAEKGNEYIVFNNLQYATPSHPINAGQQSEIRRLQIRQTIMEHLDKELALNPKGIKVLSLFFIDRVANYRRYDSEGNLIKGIYARMFEEEYKSIIKHPKYRTLFEQHRNIEDEVTEVHDGYFSADKQSKASNKREKFEAFKDTSGNTKSDEKTYNLIMRDKDKLISLDNKLRFIFSHSALKEGWDNPNVFQICTLKEAGSSDIRRRQEIGRGLRLAVNQSGERVYGHDINLLTVMATESYQQYAEGLQREIEEDSKIKFGTVHNEDFAVVITGTPGEGELPETLGKQASKDLWNHLHRLGYISGSGKVQDKLKLALSENTLELPNQFTSAATRDQIKAILIRKAGSLQVKNREDRKPASLKKEVLLSKEFIDLWERVKHKTRFEVQFDQDELVNRCISAIQRSIYISGGKLIYTKASLDIDSSGVKGSNEKDTVYKSAAVASYIPDIVTYLMDRVFLTRATIIRILKESQRLDMLKINPRRFMESVLAIIKDQKQLMLVEGIKYEKIGEDQYWTQELFEEDEITGFLHENLVESSKSPYNYVRTDSAVESRLVREMERNQNIRLYAKLPAAFKIATPLGPYNPDWVVLWAKENEKRLYFVMESKGSLLESQLRAAESAKIECGRKHFESLGTGVNFAEVRSVEDLAERV